MPVSCAKWFHPPQRCQHRARQLERLETVLVSTRPEDIVAAPSSPFGGVGDLGADESDSRKRWASFLQTAPEEDLSPPGKRVHHATGAEELFGSCDLDINVQDFFQMDPPDGHSDDGGGDQGGGGGGATSHHSNNGGV